MHLDKESLKRRLYMNFSDSKNLKESASLKGLLPPLKDSALVPSIKLQNSKKNK